MFNALDGLSKPSVVLPVTFSRYLQLIVQEELTTAHMNLLGTTGFCEE